MRTIYYISGFPRAGTTLLAALLRQNPRFHAAISSPVAPMCKSLLKIMGIKSEHATQFNDQQKSDLLRGVIENYYDFLPKDTIIFDTNRSWCAQMSLLHQLYESPKIICCVRNLAWVMDSFERLAQRNPFMSSRLFNDESESATVYSRTEALGRGNRVVGYSISALREAFYGQFSASLLLVEYELFACFPQKCLKLVYDFIEEDYFEHDTDNVEYEDSEFDRQIGIPNMHMVKKKVEFRQRKSILPPDIFKKYDSMNFWRKPSESLAKIISQSSSDKESS
ncbi:MAG: sulfotransferase family protein [Roseovarius sp.]|nr:sulfotransferase family protein [Roseovarius sp.]